MAWTSGIATDYLDLLDKLRVFLTSTMTPAGERWTALAWVTTPYAAATYTYERELYLRGPGLAGADEIYVNLRAFKNVATDVYNWDLRGAVGYQAGIDFAAQPGVSPAVYQHLRNAAIPYWIVANGRRFVVVANVSTVYEACAGGFFLPYATPGQYPYPLLVGGTSSSAAARFSSASGDHGVFCDPARTALRVRLPDGTWADFYNWYESAGRSGVDSASVHTVWPGGWSPPLRDNVDGSYALLPLILQTPGNGTKQLLGEIDACFWVSGFGAAAEDLVTVGGVDHLVVQDTFRTARTNYWALRLE